MACVTVCSTLLQCVYKRLHALEIDPPPPSYYFLSTQMGKHWTRSVQIYRSDLHICYFYTGADTDIFQKGGYQKRGCFFIYCMFIQVINVPKHKNLIIICYITVPRRWREGRDNTNQINLIAFFFKISYDNMIIQPHLYSSHFSCVTLQFLFPLQGVQFSCTHYTVFYII